MTLFNAIIVLFVRWGVASRQSVYMYFISEKIGKMFLRAIPAINMICLCGFIFLFFASSSGTAVGVMFFTTILTIVFMPAWYIQEHERHYGVTITVDMVRTKIDESS